MNKISSIKKKIAKLEAELLSIQEECSHPKAAVDVKFKSNTGNYDPTADCYWKELHCKLCDKQWTTEQ